jgi:hypothetical protein
MEWRRCACGSIGFLMPAVCAFGAAEPNQPGNYVSRQEYEALLKQVESLRAQLAQQEKAAADRQQTQKELEDLKAQLARQEKALESQEQTGKELERLRARVAQQEKMLQAQEQAQKQVENLKAQLAQQEKAIQAQEQVRAEVETLDGSLAAVRRVAEASGLGDTKLLITGDMSAGYVNQEHGDNTFFAEFSPMFLWQLNERLFFEGGLDVGLSGPELDGEGGETDVELGAAYLTYLLTDYALAGLGLFPLPFTAYHNHFDASWINKLPTDPLVYGDDGIAPDSGLGVFATGAFPCHRSQFNYAAWVTNGPALITAGDDAGRLNFANYDDTNNSKAVGGRIGWLPIPQLRVGFSFQWARVNPPGFENVDSQLYGIDWDYVGVIHCVAGQVTARGGWVWSDLGSATYPALPGAPRFGNDSNGGYAELAYRPTEVAEKWLRNFEFVGRYDRLAIPTDVPSGGTENQWTAGVDYWITARTVLKAAYTWDDREQGEDQNLFALQLATGF